MGKVRFEAPYVTIAENGSLNIQWFGEEGRVCICLECDPKESSWHVVKKLPNAVMECGTLDTLDPKKLRQWIEEI